MVALGFEVDVAARRLAAKARKSISNYCFSECKAYCCRQGYLLLTEREARMVVKVDTAGLRVIDVHEGLGGKRFALNLGASGFSCPNLSGFKCLIHKSRSRPLACREFPLFIRKDKIVMVTFRCPAAKENLLYPFLAKFKKMGYKIVYDQER